MRVYVAGPYSGGDIILNIRAAIRAASRIMDAGHAPFCPHLTGIWHLVSPKEYEQWLAYDFEWIRACEALVRLPGESPGADREVKIAEEEGIPVYFGVGAFLAAQAPKRKTK
ncbi:MAG TPA: DUF4406 domain-containing protein [Dehalococcoidia bacterium]|nr:DUF4406 domain-containing protein [Dehalococcoidia bacterium]